MKIILSSEEFAPVLEYFRAEHDPDNPVSLKDIIDNWRANQAFVTPLSFLIMKSLFMSQDTTGLGPDEESLMFWLDDNFSDEIFVDNLVNIEVLGESCDIVLTFR